MPLTGGRPPLQVHNPQPASCSASSQGGVYSSQCALAQRDNSQKSVQCLGHLTDSGSVTQG